ncbi:hypothetical protein J6590_019229 [Homalodisca vitripennis]|nr:hypothetical protein J6590_019229 [Homalodisca vitripennis]
MTETGEETLRTEQIRRVDATTGANRQRKRSGATLESGAGHSQNRGTINSEHFPVTLILARWRGLEAACKNAGRTALRSTLPYTLTVYVPISSSRYENAFLQYYTGPRRVSETWSEYVQIPPYLEDTLFGYQPGDKPETWFESNRDHAGQFNITECKLPDTFTGIELPVAAARVLLNFNRRKSMRATTAAGDRTRERRRVKDAIVKVVIARTCFLWRGNIHKHAHDWPSES